MTLTISKNSWHCWIANFGKNRVYKYSDICSYTRAFFVGLFWFTLAFFATALVVGGTGNMLYEMFTADKLSEFAGIFATIYAVIFLLIFAGVAIHLYREKFCPWLRDKMPRREPSPPGFVKQAYKSFKEKTCWRIDIK